jgi:tetratricopeptide (TPR) repeat protein
MKRSKLFWATIALVWSGAFVVGSAQDKQTTEATAHVTRTSPGSSPHQGSPSFGHVHFENSCAPAVQPSLQRAVALLHSFEFGEAISEFRAVESEDSSCTIAAWGVALSNLDRDGPNRPVALLDSGWKELLPWLSPPAKTEREQMYLEAVSKLYADYENTSGDERWDRYTSEMQQIRAKYPHDQDASLLYALALTWTTRPGEPGIEHRREALKILSPIFEQNPNHPGASHYIIHAADTPELAALALPAARKYAAIAPGSPHALHMPSHIFSRLGYWQESLNSNIASAQAAAAWIREGRDGRFDEQHALNHIEYAYLQLGQDRKAFEQINVIGDLMDGPGGDPWGRIDARIYFDLDTHNWADALQIQSPDSSPFSENLDTFWVHTIAAARLGKADEASTSLEDFKKSSSAFEKQHGWGDVIHLELLEAEAWVLFAQQDQTQAVATLREAVRFEQAHPTYYPDVLPRPAAEMLGEMLLLLKSPSEALAAYKIALTMAPNRLDSLIGARDAAASNKQPKVAAHYAATIQLVCGRIAGCPER